MALGRSVCRTWEVVFASVRPPRPACSKGGTMSRPQSEAEYLARWCHRRSPRRPLGRRSVLAGGLGLGAAFGGSALLAACGGGSSSSSSSGGGTASATGTVTLGSNTSDDVPKKTYQTLVDDFQTKNPGLTVKVNTVDHNTFQENINNYLQGKPDDVFTWFAGYRMRFFAAQGLAGRPQRRVAEPPATPTRSRRRPPATTASSTSSRRPTTRGRSSTASRSGRSTATRCPRRWTSSRRSPRR